MKHILFILLLLPVYGFSKDLDFNQEYHSEGILFEENGVSRQNSSEPKDGMSCPLSENSACPSSVEEQVPRRRQVSPITGNTKNYGRNQSTITSPGRGQPRQGNVQEAHWGPEPYSYPYPVYTSNFCAAYPVTSCYLSYFDYFGAPCTCWIINIFGVGLAVPGFIQ